jgi:hypothetical protein
MMNILNSMFQRMLPRQVPGMMPPRAIAAPMPGQIAPEGPGMVGPGMVPPRMSMPQQQMPQFTPQMMNSMRMRMGY